MNTRRITLIVAVLLAIGTGVLTLTYLKSINKEQPAQQAQVEMKKIIITSRDIPVRAKITADMLTQVSRPASEAEPQAIGDFGEATGKVALIAMPAGSTVTVTKVGTLSEAGLTARLQPGLRAISIPVDRVKAVSNLVQPGDRVDVLASVSKGSGIPPKTFTIIRGALVLAINSQLEQISGTGSPPPDSGAAATVTLGVTPAQADLLTVADINSTLRLALRSPQEPVNSLPAETLTFSDLGAPPAAPAPVNVPPPINPMPAPSVVPALKKPAMGVPVIDGDHFSAGS